MSQQYYARSLKPASKTGSFEEFRRQRALFSWLTNSRTDVSRIANQDAQVTEKTYGTEEVNELNKGVR